MAEWENILTTCQRTGDRRNADSCILLFATGVKRCWQHVHFYGTLSAAKEAGNRLLLRYRFL